MNERKIKIEDLRLNDLVLFNGEAIRVNSINGDLGAINIEYTKYGEISNRISIEDISPISLIPEILEKNGWVLKEWSGHKQFQYTTEECGDEIIFKIDYEEPHFIVQCFRASLELKYVHNFQHLLKDCEIEKEITL